MTHLTEIEGLKARIKCLEKLAGEQSLRVMQQATRAKESEEALAEMRRNREVGESVEVPLHELYRIGEMADVCLSHLTGLECPYCKCGWQADASD